VEESGRIRRAALAEAGVTEADLKEAYRLEWRRKIKLEVWPGMPLLDVDAICGQIAKKSDAAPRRSHSERLKLGLRFLSHDL
jgi:hypothetical protein